MSTHPCRPSEYQTDFDLDYDCSGNGRKRVRSESYSLTYCLFSWEGRLICNMLSQIWQVWHRMEGVISFALAWSCEEFPSEPIVMEKCVGMWSNMWLATEVFDNCAGMWSSMWLATEVLGNAFTEVCETKYQEFAFLNHFFIWSWFDFRLFTRMSVALMQLQRELCYLLLMGVLGKFISQVAWCFFQASIGSQVYMFSLVLIRIIVQVEYWYQPLIYVAKC